MLTAIAAVLALVIAFALSKPLGDWPLNALGVFLLPWVPLILLLSLPGVLGGGMDGKTVTMFFVAGLSVAGGALLAAVLTPSRAPHELMSREMPTVPERRLVRVHVALSACQVVVSALAISRLTPVVLSLGGWGAVFSSSGRELRDRAVLIALERSRTGFSTASLVEGALGYPLYIFGLLCSVTAALLWIRGKYVLSVAPLLVVAIEAVLTGQRTGFMKPFSIFVMALLLLLLRARGSSRGASRPQGRVRRALTVVSLIGAVGAALAVPVLLRANSHSGAARPVASLVNYLVGGIAGLNARNQQNPAWAAPEGELTGDSPVEFGWGSYSFTGIAQILERLGVAVPQARVNLDYYGYSVFGEDQVNNTATALAPFFYDFRWAGLVFIPFILALVTTIGQRRFDLNGGMAGLVSASTGLTVILWSFFGNWFSDFRLIVFWLFGGLILDFLLRPRTGLVSNGHMSIEESMPTQLHPNNVDRVHDLR